ncbi:hypothetical protein BDW60DRAFT_223691 [Aspergillus nidulans var. acristatus]
MASSGRACVASEVGSNDCRDHALATLGLYLVSLGPDRAVFHVLTHLQAEMPESNETTCWQQVRHYKDHLGHPVVLEQYIQDYEADPSHLVPIQIYSTVPLDADHEDLRAYLLQGFYNDDVLPLFEIYSFCPPDAFACIEHNRRGIAYRKAQHRLKVPNLPPLIPRFFNESSDRPIGRCLLLRSHSYRLGSDGDWDLYTEAGGAPDLLAFNRSFSRSHADVDQEQRREDVDDEPGLAGFELSIERVQCQIDVSQVIVGDIFANAQHPGLEYALNADEGVPANAESPPGDEAEIRQQLERQSTEINYIFDSTFRILEDEDAGVVTFTNTSEDEPDLQYLVYAPFLSHWRNVPHSSIPLLKATSTSWSSIRPTHSHVLQALRAPFPIHCICPQYQSGTVGAAKRMLTNPYRIFAVVLDRPNFVEEAGVYFYMSEYTPSVDLPPEAQPHPDDTEVWRVAGMKEVSRLLGMLGVGEGRGE